MEQLLFGLTVMLIGMLIVFVGLYILIFAIHILSYVASKIDARHNADAQHA